MYTYNILEFKIKTWKFISESSPIFMSSASTKKIDVKPKLIKGYKKWTNMLYFFHQKV